MRIFVSKNVVLLFLVTILTIDASRILYFPLPKIHSTDQELKSSPTAQESEKNTHERKSISNEFIPLSAMERLMFEEQYDSEKQDISSWDASEKRLAAVANGDDLDEWGSLHRETRIPTKKKIDNDALNEAFNKYYEPNGGQINNEPWLPDTADTHAARLGSEAVVDSSDRRKRRNDLIFLAIVCICTIVGILGLVAAAIFWYKIQKRAEAALDSEYPSYGVTGPSSSGSRISPSTTMSDRKLAHSAQMFHYQQQRQQMMAQEKADPEAKPVHSDDSDDEAPGGGDYTVYECPGLAPTGEMEVRNPLFSEPESTLTSSTTALHPTTNNHYPQPSSSPPKEKS